MFSNPRGSAEVMVEKLPHPQVMRDGSGVSCRAPWTISRASKTRPLVTDDERRLVQMNSSDHTHMRCQRRGGPQEPYNSARQRHCSIYTEAQDGVVPVRRTDGVDRAFPLKPVHYRRTVTFRTQDSRDPYESEKSPSHPRGLSEVSRNWKNGNKKPMEVYLVSQEHLSNGIREATGSQQPRRDSPRLPNAQQRVAKAIHAKELLLQEKLQRIEKKIRNKIQRESTATGDDEQKSEEEEEERHGRRRAEQEKERRETRMSLAEQQRREPAKRRETVRQDKRQEDIKQQRKKQDQWNKDRMRNTHEEERGRWDGREIEIVQKPQSKRDRDRGFEEVIAHERGGNGELNRGKRENVKEKEQNRRKGGNGEKAKEKVKEREQNKTFKEDIDWTREKKYMEQTSKERYGSNADEREQGLPQKSRQKPAHRLATENHSGKGRRASREPLLPAVSSPSQPSRLQRGELGPRESTDTQLQLLPCEICGRKFSAERLEKHLKICEKAQQSHRKVFNSYNHRTKGTSLEEFLKTHTRSHTPERKNNWRKNHEVFIRNMRQGHDPGGTHGGTLQPQPSAPANPDYVTCPHCSRRFGPGPAERHIPKCQNIKSRPPPPRYRQ